MTKTYEAATSQLKEPRGPRARRKPRAPPKAATESVGPGSGRRKPPRARKVSAEARRQAILKAALAEFAAPGFEAARLDDVAARAGVAKGTLSLYFRDKQALFEALVRNAVSPLLEHMGRIAAAPDI